MEQEQLHKQKERNCLQETQTALQRQNEQIQKAQQVESATAKVSEATFSAMRQAALSMFKQRTKDLTKVAELQEEMNVLEAQLAQIQGTTTQLQHLHANLENAIEAEENKVKQRTAQVHAAHEHVRQLAEEHTQVNILSKNTSKVALQLKKFVQDINNDGSQLRLLCAQARRLINHRSLHDFRSLCGELRRRRFMLESLTSKLKENAKQQEAQKHSSFHTTEENVEIIQEQEECEEEEELTVNYKSEINEVCSTDETVDFDNIATDENSNRDEKDMPVKISKILTDFATLLEEERTELLGMLEQWVNQTNANKSSQITKANNVTMVNYKQDQAKWQEYDELQVMHSHMRDLLQSITNSTNFTEEELQEEISIDSNNNTNFINGTSETATVQEENMFHALPLVQITTHKSELEIKRSNIEGDDVVANANVTMNIPDIVDFESSDVLMNKVNTLIDRYTRELNNWCTELERVHAACNYENIFLRCNVIKKSEKSVNAECMSTDNDTNEESNEEQQLKELVVKEVNESDINTIIDKKDGNTKEYETVKCVLMQSVDDLKKKWQTFYANYGDWVSLREEYIDRLRELKELQDQVRESQNKLHMTQAHITELKTNTLHDNVQHTAILSEEVENYVIVATRAHHTLHEQAQVKVKLMNKINAEEKEALAWQEEISRNASVEVEEQTEWSALMNDLHNLVQEEQRRKSIELQHYLDEAQNVMQVQQNKLTEVNSVCDKLMEHITSNTEKCKENNVAIINSNCSNKSNCKLNEMERNRNIVLVLEDCNCDGLSKMELPEDTITLLPENVHMLSEAHVKEVANVLLSFTRHEINNNKIIENSNITTNTTNEASIEKETMPDVLAMELSQHDEKEKDQAQEEEQRTNVDYVQDTTICALKLNKEEEEEEQQQEQQQLQQQQQQQEEDNVESANARPASNTDTEQNEDNKNNNSNATKNNASEISTIVRYWASLLPASVCQVIAEKLHTALQEKEANRVEHEKVMQRIAKNIELLQQVCSQVQYEEMENFEEKGLKKK